MFSKDRLIRLRKEKGWSQEDLGSRMNVSRQAVSRWESGTAVPEVDKLEDLSNLFNVSVGYLLETEDRPEQSEAGSEEKKIPKKRSWILPAIFSAAIICLLGMISIQNQKIERIRSSLNQMNNMYDGIFREMSTMKSELADTIEEALANDYSIMADYSLSLHAVDREKNTFTVRLEGVLRKESEKISVFAKSPDGSLFYPEEESSVKDGQQLECLIEVPWIKGIQWYISADEGTMRLLQPYDDMYYTTVLNCEASEWSLNKDYSPDAESVDCHIDLIFRPSWKETLKPEGIIGTMKLIRDSETVFKTELTCTETGKAGADVILPNIEANEAADYDIYVDAADRSGRVFKGTAGTLKTTRYNGFFQSVLVPAVPGPEE